MEFIQIIVIFAIIGFAVVRNVRKELAKERRRNPAKPVAQPEVSVPQHEEERWEADEAPPVSRPRVKTGKKSPPPPLIQPAEAEAAASGPPHGRRQVPHPQKRTPGNDIRLGSPEEARRAFIYSEIFNRKY